MAPQPTVASLAQELTDIKARLAESELRSVASERRALDSEKKALELERRLAILEAQVPSTSSPKKGKAKGPSTIPMDVDDNDGAGQVRNLAVCNSFNIR